MNLRRSIFIGGMKLKKAAPHIMVALGVAGFVYTVVDACIRSRKLDEEIEEEVNAVEVAQESLEEVLEASEDGDTDVTPATIKDSKKIVKKAKRALYKKIVRYYLKTIAIGSLSVILIGGGHAILTNRLAIATTTLVALETDFRDYRNAVKAKYGEEAEQEIMYGRQMEEREVTSTDPETGEEKTETVKVAKWREGHSVYAMAFCKSYCGGMFSDNQYYDNVTITNMRKLIEKDYEKKGYAFLQKAYDFMHCPITKEVIGTGWMKGLPQSDGYINLTVIPTIFEFTPGEMENGYIIDFNVDGKLDNYFGSIKEEW